MKTRDVPVSVSPVVGLCVRLPPAAAPDGVLDAARGEIPGVAPGAVRDAALSAVRDAARGAVRGAAREAVLPDADA
ncbi:MAG TPA: hypothetical protein VIQ74_06750, partial [Gemmatimonadaceae bacterium]